MNRNTASDTGKRRLTASVSHRVRLVLVSIAVVVFGLFYLVGYDLPFDENPEVSAPLFTDLVLWFIYVLLAAITIVTAVSVVCEIRVRSKDTMMTNGVPAARIAWFAACLLLGGLALTFAFSSVEPLRINGRLFDSALWLRMTDMFINTSILLITVAVAAVAFGMSGLNRRLYSRKRH